MRKGVGFGSAGVGLRSGRLGFVSVHGLGRVHGSQRSEIVLEYFNHLGTGGQKLLNLGLVSGVAESCYESGDEPVAKSLPVWNLDRRFIASFSNAEESTKVGIAVKRKKIGF